MPSGAFRACMLHGCTRMQRVLGWSCTSPGRRCMHVRIERKVARGSLPSFIILPQNESIGAGYSCAMRRNIAAPELTQL
jgi:hypothetical protein